MSEDYGFNLGKVFGNGGHKKSKKGKSKDPFGVSSLDNNFLSYVKSGNSDGGMGGFGSYLNYGNEKISSGKRDDFFAYIPNLGEERRESHSGSKHSHHRSEGGLYSNLSSTERTISKANRNTVKSYNEHKERVEKEREEAKERKKAKRLLEDNLASARERQDREAREEHEKQVKAKEMIEKKRGERNMSTFNQNVRNKMVERDDRYSGKGQVLDSDKENLR
jgi:hypothetical protein